MAREFSLGQVSRGQKSRQLFSSRAGSLCGSDFPAQSCIDAGQSSHPYSERPDGLHSSTLANFRYLGGITTDATNRIPAAQYLRMSTPNREVNAEEEKGLSSAKSSKVLQNP